MQAPADHNAQTALQQAVEEMARFREAVIEERQQQAETQPLGRGAYKRFAILLDQQS